MNDCKNLRAVQQFIGDSKLENIVRHLGIEVDDALDISEQTGFKVRFRPEAGIG